jgi:hypothetical protein
MVWLADITLGSGARLYFAEDAVRFAGQDYLPYLRLLRGPRFTRTQAADAAEIEVLNTDQPISALAAEPLEGTACELRELLIGLEEGVVIFRGRLTEQEETDTGLRFRVVSELDPAHTEVHARRYGQLCTWQFARPGRATLCGYNPLAAADVSEAAFGERTADVYSAETIGDSSLNEAVDAHADRIVVITAGAGRGQKRRIRSNTATTFTLYHPWQTVPNGTSKFRVVTLPNGAPQLLKTATGGKLESLATSATPRTLADTTLAMSTDEFKGALLYIVDGAAAGQARKIGTNSGTQFTLDAAETDLSPAPAPGDKFRVLYRTCAKDFAPSCEERARTQAFDGFPTLVPLLRRSFGGVFAPTGGSADGSSSGGSGGAGRPRIVL